MRPIDAHTKLVLLLGYPLGHSFSPLIHNTAFEVLDLNYRYVCAPVHPEALPAALEGMRALNVVGCNVTIPHKTGVFEEVDEHSPDARVIGAVNTVVCQRRDNKVHLFGDNTDVEGFLVPLRNFPAAQFDGKPLVVLGNGGAARAVTYALLKSFRPSRITLVGRHIDKVQSLIQSIQNLDPGHVLEAVTFDKAHAAVEMATLIVNTTPVGMHPAVSETPWPFLQTFSKNQIVYDLVYNPVETKLIRDARKKGAETIGGLEMLIQQAAASFIQWTDSEMPIPQVRKKLDELFV